jgi:ring-1,2-phenylacetyl-CoA epoxidase subunit PaaC
MNDDDGHPSPIDGHGDGDGDVDARWAFGTGFTEPLHGVDAAIPENVDRRTLAACCVALGDDALVSAQRLAEWCTRAPELEEEVALANIGLDLLGQARLLYSRAGHADGSGRGEDWFAYFRDATEFGNVTLAELPNGDFAFSVARLLVISCWRLAVMERLSIAPDPVLAAIAAKGVKELTYHRQYAAEWVVRLGDGTGESHRRMQNGIDEVARHLGELFDARTCLGADPSLVEHEVIAALRQVSATAGLILPAPSPAGQLGRNGRHTEHLAPLLDELQSVARAHPAGVW